MKIAVVGAGWAGLAAAVHLCEQGHQVTVFEAAHTAGGRARSLFHPRYGAILDNGQHILLGAYTSTLELMRRLGQEPEQLFYRMPLHLATLDGRFKFYFPKLPAPFHTLAALFRATGLNFLERWSIVNFIFKLRRLRWQPNPTWTVHQILSEYSQPSSVIFKLWEPLCLAALNTPIEQACALLFSRVLRDILNGPREQSDLLLPRVDLSALWASAATKKCEMRYGTTVRSLSLLNHSNDLTPTIKINESVFSAAVLAVPPSITARLMACLPPLTETHTLQNQLKAFTYSPIATLNLRLQTPWHLPQPIMMLNYDPQSSCYGQWIFDRAFLKGQTHQGELTIVVSAAFDLMKEARALAIQHLITQLTTQSILLPPLPLIEKCELLIEKHATFIASPQLSRPSNSTGYPHITLAGDWTDTGYPGVLEGAVRSGLQAAALLVHVQNQNLKI